MSGRQTFLSILCALAIAPASAAAAPRFGACSEATSTRVLVQVRGLKSGTGTIRAQAYSADGFLEKGRGIARVDEAAAGRTTLTICLALPGPDRYAIAVRHDANGNGKSDWNDGGGFSRNPRVSLFDLRPSFAETAIDLRGAVNRVSLVLNYRHGLSIGPV